MIKNPSHYAKMCRYAFKDNAEPDLKAMGYPHVVFVENKHTSTELYICANPFEIVVAFRATKTFADWWRTNRRAGLVKGPLGRMHRGFHEAYLSVHNTIFDNVCDLGLHRPRPVRCIGHSLGGALAMTSAGFMDVDDVITFGSPRVYSSAAASSYNSDLFTDTTRFVMAGDFITRVPWPFMGYRHVGELRYFGRDMGLVVDASDMRQCWDTMVDIYYEFRDQSLFDFEDHAIKLYEKACQIAEDS